LPIGISRIITSFLLMLFIVVITVASVEGICSIILFLQEVANNPQLPIAERKHTEYDRELGWINTPGVYVEDMYGSGIDLKINSQGFRNNQDFAHSPPLDKLRVICSGDSFTFGVGVDNDHTWPSLLSSLDKRLQTVNMGQGGYGFGQAYLWYKREGTKLEYDIHIVGLFPPMFDRMKKDEFLGYGKPRLNLRDDHLVVENIPVPKRVYYLPWLVRNGPMIKKLKSVELVGQIREGIAPNRGPKEVLSAKRVCDITSKIFESLRELNLTQNSILILVFLPWRESYNVKTSEPFIKFVRREAKKQGFLLIDLVEEFKQLPPDEVAKIFLPEGDYSYRYAAGHYSVKGNKFIANKLYAHLILLPGIIDKLSHLSPIY